MPRQELDTRKESGNVLFLILIAVALFAALSYAATKSNQSGTNVTKERTQTEAAQILQYVTGLRTTIQRMGAINGCAPHEFNFENPFMVHPDFWGGSTNDAAPSDGSCDIFGPEGTYFMDKHDISFTTDVAVEDVGTSRTELLMYFVKGESEQDIALCTAINDLLRLEGTFSGGTIRTADWDFARSSSSGLSYTNSPSAAETIGEDGATAFAGKSEGCIQGATSHNGGDRIFYFVLAPY